MLAGFLRPNSALTGLVSCSSRPFSSVHRSLRLPSGILQNARAWRSPPWSPFKRPYSIASSSKPPKSTRFDPRFFSSNASSAQNLPVLSPPAVGRWLLMSSGLVFAVIVVGGVTRLTESGLSITEWKPITGTIPPLTQAQWTEEFEKYKNTPEFKL